jgi:hypothetical protein
MADKRMAEKADKQTAEKADKQGVLSAPLHRGMPDVKLTEEVGEPPDETGTKGLIGISLESLDLDLQHSQSYGMIQPVGGCISNPGGPPC